MITPIELKPANAGRSKVVIIRHGTFSYLVKLGDKAERRTHKSRNYMLWGFFISRKCEGHEVWETSVLSRSKRSVERTKVVIMRYVFSSEAENPRQQMISILCDFASVLFMSDASVSKM